MKYRAHAEKTPSSSLFITRKIATPDQVNPNGTLFGGVIMAWIDEVAFMSARRYAGVPFVVTACIDNITFLMPLNTGEHIVLSSMVNYVGRTSMEIGVKVEKEDQYSGKRIHATSAYLTFVALDQKGRPVAVPRLRLENSDDKRRFEDGRLRVKVRERMRRRLMQKFYSSTQGSSTEINKSLGQNKILRKILFARKYLIGFVKKTKTQASG